MNADLTDITLVIDRSGSMTSTRSDAEGGINTFISEQTEQPGHAFLSLVQFDTEIEIVHAGMPIKKVPSYRLEPRGCTALLDAVGKTISDTRNRLASLGGDERPGLVTMVIVTDGLENSSHKYSKEHVKEMIARQQDDHDWQFTFLGANQDAFHEARTLGIRDVGVARFAAGRQFEAYSSVSGRTSRMRRSLALGDDFGSVGFTADELSSMEDLGPRKPSSDES